MWVVVVQVLMTLLVGLLVWVYLKQIQKRVPNIPGPTCYPLLGNLLEFGTTPQDITRNIQRLCKKYGKIFQLWLGPIHVLLITDPTVTEQLMPSSINIRKSVLYRYLSPWLGNGLLLSDSKKWHARRKLLTPAFHFTILQKAIETFHETSNIMVEQLAKHADGVTFNIYPYITLYAMDVICETAMGVRINAQKESNQTYVVAVKQALIAIFQRIFSLWGVVDVIYLNFTKEGRDFKRNIKILHEMTDKVIRERREALLADDKQDDQKIVSGKSPAVFMDALLWATNPDGSCLTNRDIREEVDTFMFEGHDTVSSALSFAFHLLAHNPNVQEKLYAEVRDVLGDGKAPTTLSELNAMKYLELVVKEVLRMYPSVPMIARQLVEEVKCPNNVTIPAGTQIILFIAEMQNNPDYFINPKEFNPERFLTDDLPNPYILIPFSAGPRNCIGQRFAMLELKATISKLVLNYEFLPPVGGEYDLEIAMAIIVKSMNGVNLRIKKR